MRLILRLLFVLASFMPCAALAQDAVGIRFGFVDSPTGITYSHEMNTLHYLEFGIGSTSPTSGGKNSGSNTSIFNRGALCAWAMLQPHHYFGDDDVAGLYGNFGVRMRMHMNVLSESGFTMSPVQGFALTPDIVGGGGLFVRLSNRLEIQAEANAHYYSSNGLSEGGRVFALGIETAIGISLLFDR